MNTKSICVAEFRHILRFELKSVEEETNIGGRRWRNNNKDIRELMHADTTRSLSHFLSAPDH